MTKIQTIFHHEKMNSSSLKFLNEVKNHLAYDFSAIFKLPNLFFMNLLERRIKCSWRKLKRIFLLARHNFPLFFTPKLESPFFPFLTESVENLFEKFLYFNERRRNRVRERDDNGKNCFGYYYAEEFKVGPHTYTHTTTKRLSGSTYSNIKKGISCSIFMGWIKIYDNSQWNDFWLITLCA